MKSQQESAKIYQKDANQCYQEILASLDTLPFKNPQKRGVFNTQRSDMG